jgi:PAS domain
MSVWSESNIAPKPGEPNPDYGEWTDYRVPDDRSGWHPLLCQFYDYWLSAAPPGRLPGRQHIAPEDMTPFLSRLWLLDVCRDPLRFRCRLIGSEMVRTLGGEVTGKWLDEVHPQSVANPSSRERFRILAEQARPTWRLGAPHWVRTMPEYRTVESCLVPLAGDGATVDIVMAVSMLFAADGRQL